MLNKVKILLVFCSDNHISLYYEIINILLGKYDICIECSKNVKIELSKNFRGSIKFTQLKHPKDVMAYSYIIIDEIYFGPHRYLYLLMGVKYILIVHNVNKHSKLSYGKSSGFRGLVKQLLYKTYFKLAKGYIAVGENTCQSLMKISKKEVVLVPFNFSYINSFRNKQITIDNSNKYVYIVVPGQVNEYKRNYR